MVRMIAILPILVAIVLILLSLRSRWFLRLTLISLTVVIVGLMAFFWLFMDDRGPVEEQTARAVASQAAPRSGAAPEGATAPHTAAASRTRSEAALRTFPVEPQPSLELALKQAASQMAQELERLYDASSRPKLVIAGDPEKIEWQAVAEAFEPLSDGSNPTPVAAEGSEEIVVRYAVHQADDARWVQVQATLPEGPLTRRVTYVDKPWAADFAAYQRSRSQARLVRLVSEFHPTAEQAKRAVRREAAELLAEDVRRAIEVQVGRGELPPEAMDAGDTAALEHMLATEVDQSPIWKDQLTQAGTRVYATVYRVQALLEIPAGAVEQLARGTGDAMLAKVRREVKAGVAKVHAGLGVAAVLLAVCMLYLLVNSATRGYYAWPLRAIAAIIAVGGSLAAVRLLGAGWV
jgi:hypothetical protein